jgi:hypothetical protein
VGEEQDAARGMSGSRFDKLERQRPEDSEREEKPRSQGAALGRFDGEAPHARPESQDASPPAPTTLERFEADGSQGLRMDRHSDEEQPFIRCPVCERDWGRFDTRCGQCGEALDTPKASDFNQALWAKRLAERKDEQDGVAQRALEQEQQQRELAQDKVRMGRAIAQQVKDDYRREHAADRFTDSWGSFRGGRYGRVWPLSIGLAFLAIRTSGPARWALFAGAAVALGVEIWLWFSRSD